MLQAVSLRAPMSRTDHWQIADPEPPNARHPNNPPTKHTARETHAPLTPPTEDPTLKKRKREDIDEADPKLKEFLEVMDPKHAAKRQREDAIGVLGEVDVLPPPPDAAESDGEYEEIPAKASKRVAKEVPPIVNDDRVVPAQPELETTAPDPEVLEETPLLSATDDDWLRSRTNRLLDLVDPADPSFAARSAPTVDVSPKLRIPTTGGPRPEEDQPDTTVHHAEEPAEQEDGDSPETLIQNTARVFVRNLPYTATEDNLRTRFEKFGAVEEVCKHRHCAILHPACSSYMMNPR